MKLFTCFLLAVLWQHSLLAQKTGQPLIDSLRAAPGYQKTDTNKVKMLIKIAETLLYLDPKEGIAPAHEAEALSRKIAWNKGEANSLNALGLLVGDTGNNVASRDYYFRALALNKAAGSGYRISSNLNNIGRTYQREANFPLALDYFLQSLHIADSIKSDVQISTVGTGLSASYLAQENPAKAREYAGITLAAATRAHDIRNIATATLHLGRASAMDKDTAAAKIYYDSALAFYRRLNLRAMEAYALSDIAELDMNQPEKALGELLEARKILDVTGPRTGFSMTNYGNTGICYSRLGKAAREPGRKSALFVLADSSFARALALTKENNFRQVEATVYRGMAELAENKGAWQPALRLYKKYDRINDSLFSQDKKNELAGLQSRHDLEIKDKEIAITRLEVSNQRLLVSAQRKTQAGLAAGLVLLGVIGAMIFRQSRQRKKTNTTLLVLNGQLDEANKIKARFFGILSHDLRGPISHLLGFLHLLKEEPDALSLQDQAIHRLQIGRSAEELLETMETMLLWSKEQMDDFRPEIKWVAVDELFAYIAKFFGQAYAARLHFSNPDALSLSTDENYLRVIMQNLTSNAMKALQHAPNGMIEWAARKDGDKTILSITDNGPGLDQEQAKTLFQEGQSVNARTGFGFHLIRDLAKAIRYTISVDSQPGRGTTFHLVA